MERFFLHILKDEKVVNSFISMMEECFPNENTYLIVSKDSIPRRVKLGVNVVFFQIGSKPLNVFLSNLGGYKHVCIHCLGIWKFYQYIRHPSISWVIWGGDLYGTLLQFKGYELFYDKKQQFRVRAGKIPLWIYVVLTNIRDYFWMRRSERVVKKLSYVITDNDCDYNIFKQYFGDYDIVFPGTINYYPIENLIDPAKLGEECSGNAIWVNNSADATGNHVWLFEMLKTFSSDIKIISPISYGDERYKTYVDKEGSRILGTRFVPLKDFLPVNDYYNTFLQANAFIFGHYRQCAVGNILMALYFGGKVFLSNRNPLLQMYKNSGFCIFSIEEDLSEIFALKPLNGEARKTNRELVLSIASYDSSIKQMKSVYGRIKTDLQ